MDSSRIVLITGASRGIGADIALEFAKNNDIVIVNYFNNDIEAKKIYQKILSFNKNVVLYKADVSNYDDVERMVNTIVGRYGKVDILINNAGICKDKLFIGSAVSEWNETININLYGVMNCTKCVLKSMIKEKNGCIINISSKSIDNPRSGQTFYTASKSAIVGFSKALAKEVGRWGIRVNVIVPGLIETDMTRMLLNRNRDSEVENIPLNRIGTCEDISKVVRFITSNECAYMTGSIINIDGGV